MTERSSVIDRITKILMWIGGAMMICAAFLIVGDIIARKLFSVGFLGLVDVTQLAVIGFAFLSMPRAFLRGAHVAIELYDEHLSPRADAALRVLAAVLGLGIFLLLGWYGWIRLERVWGYGDISQNIGIPIWIYWAMFWVGIVGSALMCLRQLLAGLYRTFKGG